MNRKELLHSKLLQKAANKTWLLSIICLVILLKKYNYHLTLLRLVESVLLVPLLLVN